MCDVFVTDVCVINMLQLILFSFQGFIVEGLQIEDY